MPAAITISEDRSHDFLKTPPTAALLRRAARLLRGMARPGRVPPERHPCPAAHGGGSEAADLNSDDLDAAVRVVAGTARSMGLRIEG